MADWVFSLTLPTLSSEKCLNQPAAVLNGPRSRLWPQTFPQDAVMSENTVYEAARIQALLPKDRT
jgi:hypothetical protein